MPLPRTRSDGLTYDTGAGEIQSLSPLGTIPGVVILHVSGANGVGTGFLRSEGTGGMLLSWKAPGSAVYGAPVNITANADYLLEDGEDRSKWIRIEGHFTLLGPVIEQRIYLADVYDNQLVSRDVTRLEAFLGHVLLYTIDFTNLSNRIIRRIAFWIDPAVVDLEISHNGSTWVTPTTPATALQAWSPMAPVGSIALHLRRTISAGSPSDTDVLNQIHCHFYGPW